MTIIDLLMDIHDGQVYFLKIDTMEIVDAYDYIKKYLPENPTDEDYEKLPSKASLHIYALPSYEKLDHKGNMSYYVKEMIEDKEIRRELFYILRNYDYMDKFYDALKKHNLYEEYKVFVYDFYYQNYEDWRNEVDEIDKQYRN